MKQSYNRMGLTYIVLFIYDSNNTLFSEIFTDPLQTIVIGKSAPMHFMSNHFSLYFIAYLHQKISILGREWLQTILTLDFQKLMDANEIGRSFQVPLKCRRMGVGFQYIQNLRMALLSKWDIIVVFHLEKNHTIIVAKIFSQ